MKFVLLLIVLFFVVSVSGQKKIKTPIILSSKDTVRVNDVIVLKKGTEPDGRFKFVRTVTSSFPAPAKCEGYEQEIYYFKNFDEEYKAFTVGFVVSLEDALKSGEIEIKTRAKTIAGESVAEVVDSDDTDKMNITDDKKVEDASEVKPVVKDVSRKNEIEPILFDSVIKVDSASKDEIYSALINWIGTNYNSSKNVIEIEDKESGLIILNALFKYETRGIKYIYCSGVIKYKMKIQIKDNRFKVTMMNFRHEAKNMDGSLGLLTTKEKRDKSLSMGSLKRDNELWNDAKMKSKVYAEQMFKELSSINFKVNYQSSEDDW